MICSVQSNPNTHPLDLDRTPVLWRPYATLDGRSLYSQVLTDRQCNCENGLVAYGTATESRLRNMALNTVSSYFSMENYVFL
jgi:hypothetical protein